MASRKFNKVITKGLCRFEGSKMADGSFKGGFLKRRRIKEHMDLVNGIKLVE